MNQKWEASLISALEPFKVFLTGVARPVGVVIYGADCEFKNQVTNTVMQSFDRMATMVLHSMADDGNLQYLLTQRQDDVVMLLDSAETRDFETRDRAAQRLRTAGAASVIGVLVKAELPEPGQWQDALSFELIKNLQATEDFAAASEVGAGAVQRKWHERLAWQERATEMMIEALEVDLPIIDGLDVLLCVSEDDE